MHFRASQATTIDEVKKWVEQCVDTNKDGYVSDQELEKALQDLRLWFAGWRSGRGMKRADLNHNGKVDNDQEMKELLEHALKHWGKAIHSKMVV